MEKMEEKVHQLLEQFSGKLPHLSDGRIDYSNSDIAPVLTVFISFHKQLLLLKRSDKVRTYKGKWNTVAGYLDNPHQTLFEKVLEELHEELSINRDQIASYSLGQKYEFTDKNNGKTWIVHPVLVSLSEKPNITIDWEHTTYTWIKADDIYEYDTVPNLKESMKRALKLASN